jgi:hypothetical protein
MTFYKYVLLVFLILFFSCKKEKKTVDVQSQNLTSNEQEDIKIKVKTKFVKLIPEAQKTVQEWSEYQNISELIPKFYNTTTKECLINSHLLSQLSQQLKDSIRIDKFNIPSFRIRLNVLHSESMRLFDMDSINSIKNSEIIQENKNIISAFNSINSKINSIITKEKLNNDLLEFDNLMNKDSLIKKKDIKTLDKKKVPKLKLKKKIERIQPLSNKKKKADD